MLKKSFCILITLMILVTSVPLNAVSVTARNYSVAENQLTPVTITKQPDNVTVANGKTAKVTLTVKGDGLRYTWYYKDSGMSSFKKTDSFKSNTYSVVMNEARNGRRLYCKITDKYGDTIISDTVVPYILSRGNHDYDRTTKGVVTAGFNLAFDDGIYNEQITGVMKQGDMSNAYRTINICGIDYLFLTLDFGPNAEMLEWADSVVAAHPEHRVIVATHGYLYRDGTTLDGNDAFPASTGPLKSRKEEQAEKPSLDGDDIWEQFASRHKNVQLVLSGHDPCQHVVYRQDKGINGNTVTQMLIDPQGIDGFIAPTAMVAMFYFSDNGNTLTVRYFSVKNDLYGSESSQFTIDLS